jgi:hypothetical protein
MSNGTTDFQTFCAVIAEWANREDWSPDLVTQFVRDAEQLFNQDLRVDRMINTYDALIGSCCAPLPLDWLEMDFLLLAWVQPTNTPVPVQPVDGCGSGVRWIPVRYMQRDEFFRTPKMAVSNWGYSSPTFGRYTLEGRQVYFGGIPDHVNGRTFRMSYYAEVPVFSDTQDSWIYTKYPSLYRCAALASADLHAVGEEDKAALMKQAADEMIKKLNNDHIKARSSGSLLKRTRRHSFG